MVAARLVNNCWSAASPRLPPAPIAQHAVRIAGMAAGMSLMAAEGFLQPGGHHGGDKLRIEHQGRSAALGQPGLHDLQVGGVAYGGSPKPQRASQCREVHVVKANQ